MRNGSALTAMAEPILPMVASRETMPGLATGHSDIATMWCVSAWLKPSSRSFSVLRAVKTTRRRSPGWAVISGATSGFNPFDFKALITSSRLKVW
ncbi:hypothetical protein D3C86_2086810 [compost metagenome]